MVGNLLNFVVKDVPYDALAALGGMKLGKNNSIEVERMIAARMIQKCFRAWRQIRLDYEFKLNQGARRIQLWRRGVQVCVF